MNIPNLYIAEIFNSIQGEGLLTGLPTIFVRTQGCRVGCIFCDTKHSWKFREDKKVKAVDVYETIHEFAKDDRSMHICLTGGEPLEQLPALSWLVEKLVRNGYKNISMETCGIVRYEKGDRHTTNLDNYVLPDNKHIIDMEHNGMFFSVSPKLVSALKNRFTGVSLSKTYKYWSKIVAEPYRIQFKFVIGEMEDLHALESLFQLENINADTSRQHFCIQIEESQLDNPTMLKDCLRFVNRFSFVRLLIQQHKVLELQ